MDGIHSAIGPKADMIDATIREKAEGVKSRCEFVLAHCTFVQALLKVGSGNKEKQAAARRDACKTALQRAANWEVQLKPSVRRAVNAALEAAA